MSKTIDDLKTAFAGESQAFQKYTAYAKKAAAQGFTNIAKLFEATAQAELIHAAGHLKTLIKSRTRWITCRMPSMVRPMNSPRCIPPCFRQQKLRTTRQK